MQGHGFEHPANARSQQIPLDHHKESICGDALEDVRSLTQEIDLGFSSVLIEKSGLHGG